MARTVKSLLEGANKNRLIMRSSERKTIDCNDKDSYFSEAAARRGGDGSE